MDNIFIRLVGDLGKLAQGRQSSELGATPREEKDLKFTGFYNSRLTGLSRL
jgi:hypothetical protein